MAAGMANQGPIEGEECVENPFGTCISRGLETLVRVWLI